MNIQLTRIRAHYKITDRKMFSSLGASGPVVFNIGDVRTRHTNNLNIENTKPFFGDPEDPSAAALKVRQFFFICSSIVANFDFCNDFFRSHGMKRSNKFVNQVHMVIW